MICKKCKKEIADDSIYCNYCGKKQTAAPKTRHRKRAHGTGTIRKDTRYKNPYIAIAPATPNGKGRQYIGAYPDMKSAQAALDNFIRNSNPELYNATFEDVYNIWSETHYKQVKSTTAYNWKTCWKWFEELYNMKVSDLRTAHFQSIVNRANTRATAKWIKALAHQVMQCALENDIVGKNCVAFVKLPKEEKTEKIIFTSEQIALLWECTDDVAIQIILAMIYMGFRIRELLTLKVENIHLDKGYVIGGIKTEAGKNRIIPFPPNIPEVKGFFEQWIGCSQGGPLFDITVAQFRNAHFYNAIYPLGMIDEGRYDSSKGRWIFPDKFHLTPHSCRHTFASISAASEMRAENLQKIIGHANYSTTAELYIHQDVDILISEMAKLKK